MRSSSARQLEFDYSDTPDVLSAAPAAPADAGTSAPFRVPHLGVTDQVYAAMARSAGRVNAANVSEEEHNLLLRERQTLLDKQFAGTITRKEQNRLEYVRWSLDRIEDAKHGQTLDVLEDLVQRYEQFLSQMRNIEMQLAEQMPHGKRGRK
jgi:hypothetical protein